MDLGLSNDDGHAQAWRQQPRFTRLEIGPPARLASNRKGRFKSFPDQNPAETRPGRPISGPEALWRNIGYTAYRAYHWPTLRMRVRQDAGRKKHGTAAF